MIPTTLAILIYQILGILGAEAVSQIVTSIAYKRRDLDYKLMYLQSPLDLLFGYKRFNLANRRKLSIILLTGLTYVLKFIPTIMTKLNSSAPIYHDFTTAALDPSTATSVYNWPSTMPVFDNFVPYLANPNANSLQDMLTAYIKDKLNQNVTANNNGYWFTPNIAKRFEWDDQQVAYYYGFYAPPQNGSIETPEFYGTVLAANFTAYVFTNDSQTSFTTSMCNSGLGIDSNFSGIHGTTVQASRQVLSDCVPVYDRSLVIRTAYKASNVEFTDKASRLDANDTLYRLPQFSEGITASSFFGASIYNHNTTHMTLGIKKTAHITLYAYGKTATIPSDCTSAGRPDVSNNFIDLPYDAILCYLVHLPGKNQFRQAASRVYVDNYALDVLYSLRLDERLNMGHVVSNSNVLMVDYTLFQAFNVEGNLKDNQEHMVAFSANNLLYDTASDIETATNFSNNKIGTLLKTLDPSRINQDTVDILVGMASMRVRWANGDYSDISLNKAEIRDGIQTPTWWIIAVSTMALIFLLPQISRLIIRRIPEYAENLRNLLLLSVERSSALEGLEDKAKTVGILLRSSNSGEGGTALLSVNGHPVTAKERSTCFSSSLMDERTRDIDESYKHPDTFSPFLQ